MYAMLLNGDDIIQIGIHVSFFYVLQFLDVHVQRVYQKIRQSVIDIDQDGITEEEGTVMTTIRTLESSIMMGMVFLSAMSIAMIPMPLPIQEPPKLNPKPIVCEMLMKMDGEIEKHPVMVLRKMIVMTPIHR